MIVCHCYPTIRCQFISGVQRTRMPTVIRSSFIENVQHTHMTNAAPTSEKKADALILPTYRTTPTTPFPSSSSLKRRLLHLVICLFVTIAVLYILLRDPAAYDDFDDDSADYLVSIQRQLSNESHVLIQRFKFMSSGSPPEPWNSSQCSDSVTKWIGVATPTLDGGYNHHSKAEFRVPLSAPSLMFSANSSIVYRHFELSATAPADSAEAIVDVEASHDSVEAFEAVTACPIHDRNWDGWETWGIGIFVSRSTLESCRNLSLRCTK